MPRSWLLLLGWLVVLAPARAPGEDNRIFLQPWVELEPIVAIEAEYPIPVEKATAWLLDEARALASAMVYGWTFDWTPGDRTRGVPDTFELVPVAEVPRGSDRLVFRQTRVEDEKLWAHVVYTMSEAEARRRSAWAGAALDGATGSGEGIAARGRQEKMAALAAAVKDAVRNHLNTRILNKPRRIRGEVVLWDDPDVRVWSGAYRAVVRVRLRVTELVPYSIF